MKCLFASCIIQYNTKEKTGKANQSNKNSRWQISLIEGRAWKGAQGKLLAIGHVPFLELDVLILGKFIDLFFNIKFF